MKAKNLLIFSSILLLFSFNSTSEKLDFEFADTYCSTIEKQADMIGKKYKLSAAEILPVVYPECSRFSNVSNVFETNILAYYYMQDGREGADFSVGYFQMKPSFLEDLEDIISKDSSMSMYKQKFSYKVNTLSEIRDERLNRLFSQSWQIEYLCAYTLIMKQKYAREKTDLPEIKFLASGYNYGFTKSSEEIITWSKKKAFPNGIKSDKSNFSYSDLAYSYKLKKYGHE